MNGKMGKKMVSDKLLAVIGVVIEEEHKLPKRVRTYRQVKRGIGYTKASHATSKVIRKMAKRSRRINRGK